MSDDFSNLRDFKDPLLKTTEKPVDVKQTTIRKPSTRMLFIITKNKNNSWIDDLDAQAQLNQIKQVYH